MKRKIYSFKTNAATVHSPDVLKNIEQDTRYSADEHAYLMREEYGDTIFNSKRNLLRHYLPDKLKKSDIIQFVLNIIQANKYKNIVSFGAGESVLEYLMCLCLPEEVQVICCDFDPFLIEKANLFFPELTAVQFDFFNNEVRDLKKYLNIDLDLAVFFSSAYVMDDDEFIRLFSMLKQAGFKEVIDFHAGYMDLTQYLLNLLRVPRKNTFIRRLVGKPPVKLQNFEGKFHGYSRSRGELRRLYAASGFAISKEISLGVYKYIAILT